MKKAALDNRQDTNRNKAEKEERAGVIPVSWPVGAEVSDHKEIP